MSQGIRERTSRRRAPSPTAPAGPAQPTGANGQRPRRAGDAGVARLARRRPLPRRPGPRPVPAHASSARRPSAPASPLPVQRQHALHQHHPRRRGAALPRQPRARAQASRAWSAGTPWPWSSRPTSRTRPSAATSPPSPRSATLYEVGFNHFFRGPDAPRRRRPGLLPGPRLARHLRPRLPRRPADRAAPEELPPRAGPGRRPVVATRTRG